MAYHANNLRYLMVKIINDLEVQFYVFFSEFPGKDLSTLSRISESSYLSDLSLSFTSWTQIAGSITGRFSPGRLFPVKGVDFDTLVFMVLDILSLLSTDQSRYSNEVASNNNFPRLYLGSAVYQVSFNF